MLGAVAAGTSTDPPWFDCSSCSSRPSHVLSGSCHSSFGCFQPATPVEDGEEGGHGSRCSCLSDPVPLLQHRSQGELSVCSDLCFASWVAFNQLGSWRGNLNMCFLVSLAVWVHHFTSTGLALVCKGGGRMAMEGGTPGSSAVLVLPRCGGVGHPLGHAWAGGSCQGLRGGLPVLGLGVERAL